MDIEYLAVGNPTVDQLPDGSGVVGGTVVYAAVQASRLGLSARVLGNANLADLVPLLPADERIVWDLHPTPESTRFRNVTEDGVRSQYLDATAGPIDIGDEELAARIVHLGPVDAEVDFEAVCERIDDDAFVGATPQGAFRSWGADHVVRLFPAEFPKEIARRLQVVVVGRDEGAVADSLMRAVSAAGGLAVRTLGSDGCEVWSGDHHHRFARAVHVDERDDTGAGDVFASALFVKLAAGYSLTDAATFAQAAAAASVRGIAVSAIADAAEIEALLTGAKNS